MTEVYTVGYQEKSQDDFICLLKQNDIQILIDVRDLPLSRKKGFSKNQLKDALCQQDIVYLHFGNLGTPKDLRDKVKQSHDFNLFFKEYRKLMMNEKQTLSQIEGIAKKKSICIMCYEKDPCQCHRSAVAEEIIKDGNMHITHL